MPIKFLANHNCIIFGMTGSGKSFFILKVIKEQLIHPFPKQVYYMYGVRQPFMDHHPNIKFIEGLDFSQMDTSKPSMLVIDDLVLECKNQEVSAAFIRESHHKQISLFYITQNLFPNCPNFRLMSANSHYFVLFYNQRNFRQVTTLARQIFVGKDVKRILEAYKRASETERGFILLSFSALLPKELTVVTDFFNRWPSVYL